MQRQHFVIPPGERLKKNIKTTQMPETWLHGVCPHGCSKVLSCASASSAETAGTWCARLQAAGVPRVQSQFCLIAYFM